MWLIAQQACPTQHDYRGEGFHHATGALCVTVVKKNPAAYSFTVLGKSYLVINLSHRNMKRIWNTTPASVCWILWKERNARCFEGKSSKIQKVKMNCLSFLNISVNKIWWGSRSFSRLYRKNVKFRDVIDDALCSLRVVSSHLHIFVSKFDVSVLFSIMTSY